MTPRNRSQPPVEQPPSSSEEEPHEPTRSQSRAARDSGTGSSGADFLADPGPEFDPKSSPPAPEPPADEVAFAEEWSEQQVREILTIQGQVTHAFFNGGPQDEETWIHTERDLGAIAPPLTRIANRYDPIRAAAAAGDEILLASALARYASRSYIQRRRYLAEQLDQGPQPVSGVPAPEGTGPESDPEYMRTVDDPLTAPPSLTPKGPARR